MPKINATCQECGTTFERFPSYFKNARGREARFCSKACLGKARTKGTVGRKRKRGVELTCEICATKFYRQQSYIKNGRSRFCSEPCRIEAFKLHMIDKTGPRPKLLRGHDITCMFCGKKRYRKKSMLVRNIGKTCGDPVCVSAYGRMKWGLEPHDDERARKPRPQRKKRLSNFTAAQRAEWIEKSCTWCGVSENLHLDHVIPVCIGGQSIKKNAQTLCGVCNNWKAANIDMPLARASKSTSSG